jgi:hypothetical protein
MLPYGHSARLPAHPLSVLKSHFKRACSFVLNGCMGFWEQRFVRTFDLQKGFSLLDCLGSEDLKSVGAPLPLQQKHTVWIRTGNLLRV